MQSITYSQVQELIMRLPAAKLSIAYDLLLDLVSSEPDTATSQLNFMLLPLIERRRLMAEQAEQMVAYYEQTKTERQDWQQGDFVDY
jgi:hypothetical protein